jgi:sodium/proline symporter
MPHILLRFMAIKEEKKLNDSRRIATVWVVISMFIAVAIGVIGYSVSVAGKVPFLTNSSDAETIIIKLADLMSQHGTLLAIVAGVILSGILAATMSTADSQLLAASSAASENIIGGLFRIKLSETAQMIVARVTLIAISVIGVVIAWDSNSSVFGIVSFAWAGFGAVFGPVMLLSLFWKRSNRYGALAGMIVGGVMVFIWKNAIAKLGGVFDIYELLPAFICGLLVNVIVSLLTPKPEKEITEVFDELKNGK